MQKYEILKQFEQDKLKELEILKNEHEKNLIALKQEYQQKIQNIASDAQNYKNELNQQNEQDLNKETALIEAKLQKNLDQLTINEDTLNTYAKELANIIIEKKL